MDALSFTFQGIIIITVLGVAQVTCCPPEEIVSSFRNLSWQTRLLERYLEIESVSFICCAQECMVRKRCKSFNYDSYMNYCELNYVAKKDGSKDQSNIGVEFVHSDINHLDKSLIGRCKDHNCDLNSKCNMKTGSCEISDCGQALALPNTTILAYGHHEINNGVFYGCLKEFSMVDTNGKPTEKGLLRCNTNGKWETPDFQCLYDGENTIETTLATNNAIISTDVSILPPKSSHTKPGTTEDLKASCPDAMVPHDGRQYCIVIHDRKTWEEAKGACISRKTNLVKLEDTNEKDWLVDKAIKKGLSGEGFWTGGNDLNMEGQFKWEVDNTDVPISSAHYDLWHSNQPDNGGWFNKPQNCIRVYEKYYVLQPNKWMIDDYKCNGKLSFICEV